MAEIEVIEVTASEVSVVEVEVNGVAALDVSFPEDVITVVEVIIPGPQGPPGVAGSGSGSQTPWTQDIDADNFNLTDLAYIQLNEIAAPSTPAANKGIVFLRDDGAGNTQLCVRFPSGSIVAIATDN